MRRSVSVLVLLAACEGDQREHCTRFAILSTSHNHPDWIDRCVKGSWSQRQLECHARSGGLQSVFCDE